MTDTGKIGPADRDEVLLYCDGACSPNPGLGGWGVVLVARAMAPRAS